MSSSCSGLRGREEDGGKVTGKEERRKERREGGERKGVTVIVEYSM